MRKVFVIIQFAILAGLCAWGLYHFFRPVPKPQYNRENWQSWTGFYTISYQGISKNEGGEYISAEMLSNHLKALREAGFHTITLEDASVFLSGGKPLPEKALLLLFEGGRKDSLIYATPALQNNRFIGVMCVPTKLTGRWETFYLDNRDLKSVSREPNWQLCSMGHKAVDLIPIDKSGTKGHFLTNPIWNSGSIEKADAYTTRVKNDYTQSAHILEKAAGKPVAAYLYPFADNGANQGPQSLAATVNLTALKQYHAIAFANADNPFNTRQSDPYDLNRLRIPADWDAKKLIRELLQYGARTKTIEGSLHAGDWIATDETKIEGNKLFVAADNVAWLRGSEGWENIDMKAVVTVPEKTTAFLYGRYSGAHSYLRLSLDKTGMRIQERKGTAMLTLADYPAAIDTAKPHAFRLRIKGNRAWALLDGKTVLGPAPLSAETLRGRVGFGSQEGAAEFTDVSIRLIPSYYVTAGFFADLSQPMQDDTGALLPRWFQEGQTPEIGAARIRDALITASRGISVIPVIEVKGGISAEEARIFTGKVFKALADPLLKPLIKTLAVRGSGEELFSMIRAKGYKIIRILSPEEALHMTGDQAQKNLYNDSILVEAGTEFQFQSLTKLLRFCPADRLIAPVDDTTAASLGVRVVKLSGK